MRKTAGGREMSFEDYRIATKSLDILAVSRERDALRDKLQYVAGQLIEAGCDDGAAPVEALARHAKKDIAALKAEVERLKADKARLELQTHPSDLERKLTLCRDALSAIESTAENAAIGTDPDNEQAIALNNICDIAQEALADTESKK
jgi:hypothetical protein